MKKTNPKKLEEFIRVDHAGERGAIKIYEGQLLALSTLINDEGLRNNLEFVNHKILDCMGDLYLSGYKIIGSVI